MPSVYIETTIVSYLAAHPSRDPIMAAHQQITHEWWRSAGQRFDLVISEAVLDEIRRGDPEAARRRLDLVAEMDVLRVSEVVHQVADDFEPYLNLPTRARLDLVHLSYAVAYAIDYLVTWNCKHLANGETIKAMRKASTELSTWLPIILTPTELMPREDDHA